MPQGSIKRSQRAYFSVLPVPITFNLSKILNNKNHIGVEFSIFHQHLYFRFRSFLSFKGFGGNLWNRFLTYSSDRNFLSWSHKIFLLLEFLWVLKFSECFVLLFMSFIRLMRWVVAETRGFPSNIILAFRPEGFLPRGFGLTELRATKGGAQPFFYLCPKGKTGKLLSARSLSFDN